MIKGIRTSELHYYTVSQDEATNSGTTRRERGEEKVWLYF